MSECRLYYRTSYKLESDECDTKLSNVYNKDALKVFFSISEIIPHNKSVVSIISSPAKQIESCTTDILVLTRPSWVIRLSHIFVFKQTYHLINVHPGQQFNFTMKALDQGGYPVPANIFVDNLLSNKHRLHPLSQTVNSLCTSVYYRLYSSEEDKSVMFRLITENPCRNFDDSQDYYQIFSIFIERCPVGFAISGGDNKCTCNRNVRNLTQNCFIDDSSFERIKNSFWISLTNNNEFAVYDSRCPLDYCRDSSVNVTLNDPSVQCDFNRTGILCGQCRENFSLALGSLHCIPCDNKHAALVLFFIMAGIILIAVIFLLHLTVAFGSLNGLFFYANIIQANHQAFFTRATINYFTIFIAWVNLDLGIETCFYDGMDIYVYSWFQFLFPFYLWFLIGCIILACRYSQSVARSCLGRNPVAVLATLFLMSFSKIIQAVIIPLSSTNLKYYNSSDDPDSYYVIWLYDGSIGFFGEPKHIAPGSFAILSIMVFVIPYISLLFFGHWLQGCSNWWILSWLNKIKPFMDAYHAPYRKHTRYWTGLLLLTRLGLFLIFAINTKLMVMKVLTS